MRESLVRALVLPALILFPARGVEAQRAPLEGLDEYIEAAMPAWDVPGLAIAVVKDDSVVHARGFGVRRAGGTAPVTEHTPFLVASLTKAFTAAAVGLQVDAGRMRWDDPVIEHLPGFRLRDPWVTETITLRDLLAHRSGLPQTLVLWNGSELGRAELIARLSELEPVATFRGRWTYQNILYLAAGEAAGRAAGEGWDALVEERIFAPLGMRESVTSLTRADTTRAAWGHLIVDGRVTPIPWRNFDNIGPAGSIMSTAADMAQWARMLLAGGRFEGRRILDSTTVAQMMAPQIPMDEWWARTMYNPEAHFIAYGLGWTLHDYRGRKVVEHTGELHGMTAVLALVPEERLGVVLLSNIDRPAMGSLRFLMALKLEVLDAYLGGRGRDWSTRFRRIDDEVRAARVSAPVAPAVQGPPARPLAAYAGEYHHPFYGAVRVRLEADRLRLDYGPAYRGTLVHRALETFDVRWDDRSTGPATVVFELDAAGTPATLEWRGVGRFGRVETTAR